MPKLGKWDVARSYSACFVQKMTRRISKKSLVSLTFFALISIGSSAVFGQVPIVQLDGSALDPPQGTPPKVISVLPLEEHVKPPTEPSVSVPIIAMQNGKPLAAMPPLFSPTPASMIPSIDVPIIRMDETKVKPLPSRPSLATFSSPSFGDVVPPPIVIQEPIASPSDIILEVKKSDFLRPIPSTPIVPATSPANQQTGSSRSSFTGQNGADQENLVPVRPFDSGLTPSQISTPRSLPDLPEQPIRVAPAAEDRPTPLSNQNQEPLTSQKNKKVINPFSRVSKSRVPQDATIPTVQDETPQNVLQDITNPPTGTDTAVGQDVVISQDLGFIDTPVTANVPEVPRSPSLVLMGEALFMTVESKSVRVNDAFGVDPFDYDLGIRITGQRIFGAEGLSLSYAGVQEWNEVARATSAGGGLNFAPIAGSGLGASALAPFKGATFQQQYHNGNYHTLELNKVTWGWDVLNVFLGIRYTHYEEELDFFSSRADGQQGLLAIDLENHIFGPQVGGELFYDIGGRFSTGVKGKLGLMATALDRETQLISNGTTIINNTDSDVNFNFMAEFGGFVRWQVLPRGYIRGGYELWYNSSVYSVDNNIPGSITSTYGTTSLDDELLIHGATIGFEFNW